MKQLPSLSVSLWARLTQISNDGSYQRGALFDCGDSISASLNGTNLTMSVALNIVTAFGVQLANLSHVQLSYQVPQLESLLQWTSFAFTVKN